jgi:hypothetical protein
MSLPNGTLPTLLEAAKESNTSTMVWAITGRNLGQYYTQARFPTDVCSRS